jgi:hypothetical protein
MRSVFRRGSATATGADRNLPCNGQPLTAKSAANGAGRWVGMDGYER